MKKELQKRIPDEKYITDPYSDRELSARRYAQESARKRVGRAALVGVATGAVVVTGAAVGLKALVSRENHQAHAKTQAVERAYEPAVQATEQEMAREHIVLPPESQ